MYIVFYVIVLIMVILIIVGQAGGNSHVTKEVVVTTSIYQMILIMANHIHMITTCYMELSMRLVAVVRLLDWVICMTKMLSVLYVDVEESLLFS